MTTMLPINKIMNHENNPRKNLGDLSELTESIRINGILQPLTVVAVGEAYKVIIGHRRLEAARQAELEEVPCEIKELTDDAQLNVMMMENMLRENLTAYEEAKGFQMMLDLGKTVEQVSAETGFSTTTVRKRTKLLSLDEGKFRASVQRGATLNDLVELDKISDPHTRNAVLTHAGTPEFKSKLNQAIEKEKKERAFIEAEQSISQWAAKVDQIGVVDGETKPMRFVLSWYYGKEIPPMRDDNTYYYTKSNYSITIYADGEDDAEAERRRKIEEQKRIDAELLEVTESCYKLRVNFLKNFKAIRKYSDIIMRRYMKASLADRFRNSWRGEGCKQAINDILGTAITEDTMFALDDFPVERIALAYIACDADSPKACTWRQRWDGEKYIHVYEQNDKLTEYYRFLMDIGYQPSQEEKDMMNGNVDHVVKE